MYHVAVWIIVLTFLAAPMYEVAYTPNGGPIAKYATLPECVHKTLEIAKQFKKELAELPPHRISCKPVPK